MANKIADKLRTVGGDTMTSVLEFTPNDGFKLKDDLLDKVYTVISVDDTEFGENKSFVVAMEDEEGNVINLSGAAFKKARILGKADATGKAGFEGATKIFTRSEADDIWNGSAYLHASKMKKGEEYIVPAQIHLKYAVIAEDGESGEPALNNFFYKGYRKVVAFFQKKGEFPTKDDFIEELSKSVADGRIPGLSPAMTKPEKQDWVKVEDPSNYRHTLILMDVAD